MPEQLALVVPLPVPAEPPPPTYWECRGPRDWQPVKVVCRYGPTRGIAPVFPHVRTKPSAPRNVTIRRADGHHRVVPVRTLRRRNPDERTSP